MKNKVYRNPFNILYELKKISDKGNRIVLVSDQDGVLAEFIDDENYIPNWRTLMKEKGYFSQLPPIPSGLEFAKMAIKLLGRENFWICTKGPTAHSYDEKAEWIKRYLPEMDPENIIAISPTENKAHVVHKALLERGINPNCAILVDDFGKNLREWYEAWKDIGGCSYLPYPTIKVKNGYNYHGKRCQLCPVIQLRTRDEARMAWKAQKQVN